MTDEEREQEIQNLMERGWDCNEITRYEIYDPNGNLMGEGDDEDEAWQDVFDRQQREAMRFAKQQLAKWNNAVMGVKS
jgi:hypothetical protein